MYCPVCKTVNLEMSERQGIEIDYCPQCRGVWLDRGELDKIIERTVPAAAVPSSTHSAHTQPIYTQDHRSNPQNGDYRKRKKEGFLSDLFDFD